MSNYDITAAQTYHEMTNYTPQRLSQNSHVLDPSNRPLPYKIYSSLTPLPLPKDLATRSLSALAAIASPGVSPASGQVPDREDLARLCLFSNGVTKVLRFSGHEYPMRAAACTGALFHIELYLVCGELADLAAGIYHYGAHDHTLRLLRVGDFRQVLVDATASEPAIAHAPVIAISTSTFWRNAYKYRSRAYRHTFWDDGTILANALALSKALDLPAKVVLGFVDERVNALLDIDGEHEAAVSMLALGHTGQIPPEAPPLPPLAYPTEPLSTYEVAYPDIVTVHRESSLPTPQEVAEWRNQPPLALPTLTSSTPALVPPNPSLGQDLGGDAAVNLYFLVDLDALLARYGNRGYRVAQLDGCGVVERLWAIVFLV